MQVEFPEKLAFLAEPARYKVLYGGRGGAKSWGIARHLLIDGVERPLRILCARELMKSIKDSVHRLLADQVVSLGLQGHYEVLANSIKGRNGTEFGYASLRHNITEIKSWEGADRCWIEEAQTVSRSSWETLIPTIRKDDSEIWVSFNPELDTDETYKRFVLNPPKSARVVKINWSDNQFFPAVLRQEMEDLKERDPDAWLTVWEGHCRQALDGAIYAKEIREATAAGRITSVPYNAIAHVDTFWDLGHADATAVWFAQRVGLEYRIIDYLENSQQSIDYYIRELQRRPYRYGSHFLPHDAKAKQLATGRSIEEIMRHGGLNIRIVPNLSITDGINAARLIFSNCWFDAELCADGINCLRRYRYKVDPDTRQVSREPLHDYYSNGADAFRMLALGLKEPARQALFPAYTREFTPHGSDAWMH